MTASFLESLRPHLALDGGHVKSSLSVPPVVELLSQESHMLNRVFALRMILSTYQRVPQLFQELLSSGVLKVVEAWLEQETANGNDTFAQSILETLSLVVVPIASLSQTELAKSVKKLKKSKNKAIADLAGKLVEGWMQQVSSALSSSAPPPEPTSSGPLTAGAASLVAMAQPPRRAPPLPAPGTVSASLGSAPAMMSPPHTQPIVEKRPRKDSTDSDTKKARTEPTPLPASRAAPATIPKKASPATSPPHVPSLLDPPPPPQTAVASSAFSTAASTAPVPVRRRPAVAFNPNRPTSSSSSSSLPSSSLPSSSLPSSSTGGEEPAPRPPRSYEQPKTQAMEDPPVRPMSRMRDILSRAPVTRPPPKVPSDPTPPSSSSLVSSTLSSLNSPSPLHLASSPPHLPTSSSILSPTIADTHDSLLSDPLSSSEPSFYSNLGDSFSSDNGLESSLSSSFPPSSTLRSSPPLSSTLPLPLPFVPLSTSASTPPLSSHEDDETKEGEGMMEVSKGGKEGEDPPPKRKKKSVRWSETLEELRYYEKDVPDDSADPTPPPSSSSSSIPAAAPAPPKPVQGLFSAREHQDHLIERQMREMLYRTQAVSPQRPWVPPPLLTSSLVPPSPRTPGPVFVGAATPGHSAEEAPLSFDFLPLPFSVYPPPAAIPLVTGAPLVPSDSPFFEELGAVIHTLYHDTSSTIIAYLASHPPASSIFSLAHTARLPQAPSLPAVSLPPPPPPPSSVLPPAVDTYSPMHAIDTHYSPASHTHPPPPPPPSSHYPPPFSSRLDSYEPHPYPPSHPSHSYPHYDNYPRGPEGGRMDARPGWQDDRDRDRDRDTYDRRDAPPRASYYGSGRRGWEREGERLAGADASLSAERLRPDIRKKATPCRFFGTAGGCRAGERCPFAHHPKME